jgi:hypothetical protein
VMPTIAQIIAAIAWPAITLVIALMFRRAILDLLPRIRTLEAKGLKLILDRLEKEGQLPVGGRAELSGLSSHDIWALHSFAQKEIPVTIVAMKPMQRVAARTLYDAGLLTVRGEGNERYVDLTPLGVCAVETCARSRPS